MSDPSLADLGKALLLITAAVWYASKVWRFCRWAEYESKWKE